MDSILLMPLASFVFSRGVTRECFFFGRRNKKRRQDSGSGGWNDNNQKYLDFLGSPKKKV